MSSTADASVCVSVFFDALVCCGFLPLKLITDLDPKFISAFGAELMKRLKVYYKVVNTYHQQADSAECYVYTIQTLLQLYIVADDWVECLPFVELVMKNTPHFSLCHSPNQQMFIDSANPIFIIDRSTNADIPEMADRLALARPKVDQASDNLKNASLLQKHQYDNRHRQGPLRPCDTVLILIKQHSVRSLVRGMHKLKDNKWGPFRILEMVGTQVARLDLPPSTCVHSVVSTHHPQPFVKDTFRRVWKPPPAAMINRNSEWGVAYMFGEHTRGRGSRAITEFKIKWLAIRIPSSHGNLK